MRMWNTAGAAAVASAALLMAPPGSSAQIMDEPTYQAGDERRVDLRARGGVAVPAMDLTEYANAGLHLGGEAAWWVNEYMAVRLDGNVDAMPGLDEDVAAPMPNMRFWNYGGGLDFDLMGRTSDSPLELQAKVGAGATTLDTEDLVDPPAGADEADITQTYPNVNAGIEVGYRLAENVSAAVGTTALMAFVDEEDMAPVQALNPAAEPLERATMFPITARVQIGIPN